MNAFCIAIVVVLILLITWIIYDKKYRTCAIEVDGFVINILSDNHGAKAAREAVTECDRRLMKLFAHLRKKYRIGVTDEECAPGSQCATIVARNERVRIMFDHMLRGFNYEEVHEHNPSEGDDVAYSLDKGRKIMLCLRDARQGNADINTLMFVILHECAHIANYNEWGHEAQYWSIFKRLIMEATDIGVYTPADYARAPVYYCKFELNHNPYYDNTITPI